MNNVFIIAEAGVNHNGSFELAKQLVDRAVWAGADCVKFQTFNPNLLASKYAAMAEYQKKNLGVIESQKDMLSRLTLKKEDYIELASYCRKLGIQFLSTPFEIESVRFLNNLQDVWKIPSGEITNYPYLVEIAKTEKDVILSTGMSDLKEVEAAYTLLKKYGTKKITLLHCTTNYPTPMSDVNLKAMLTLKEQFACPVGYSDHTRGIEVSVAAAAMGASVIEKHFTLDKNMEGPDHKASLEPDDLKAMVMAIRNIEVALGDGRKRASASEMQNISVVRKSIIASRDIKKGEMFTESNITTKRPGTGINPMRWNEVVGAKAIRDFEEDELIEL